MKDIKIAIFSFFCVFAFCSCQNNNYSELIVGTWELDMGTSYEIRHGKRHYYDEEIKNPQDYANRYYRISFSDASTRDVRVDESLGDVRYSKYHLDGEYIYTEGSRVHIVELNKKRMILEEDDEEGLHFEFHKISNDKPQLTNTTIKPQVDTVSQLTDEDIEELLKDIEELSSDTSIYNFD